MALPYSKVDYRNALETFRNKNPQAMLNNVSSPAPTTTPENKAISLADQIVNKTQSPVQQINAPASYQGFNPQASAEYQAALREAQRNAQTAQANTTAQLRATGQGKSSYSEAVANQIGQRELGRVSDTVLPQLAAQDYARYRDSVTDQYRVDETNYNREQDQLRNLLGVSQHLSDLDQQGLDNQYRTDALREQQKQSNISNAMNLSQLFGTAVQPKESGEALFDQVSGLKSLTAQQMEYQQEYQRMRDQIEDERYRQKFDEDVRRFGLEYAADQAYRAGQLSLQRQSADIAASNHQMLLAKQRDQDNARQFSAQLYDDLGQLQTEEDLINFLRLNAGEIVNSLGQEEYERILRSVSSPFDYQRQQQANQAEAERRLTSEATKLAQSESNWELLSVDKRRELINAYLQLLQQ